MIPTALKAAQEQLAYWERECEDARRRGDDQRVERCEHFIAQCKLMISALQTAHQALGPT